MGPQDTGFNVSQGPDTRLFTSPPSLAAALVPRARGESAPASTDGRQLGSEVRPHMDRDRPVKREETPTPATAPGSPEGVALRESRQTREG